MQKEKREGIEMKGEKEVQEQEEEGEDKWGAAEEEEEEGYDKQGGGGEGGLSVGQRLHQLQLCHLSIILLPLPLCEH